MDLTKYIIGYSPEFIENGNFAYIDIAIEFDLQLFRALKLDCEPDENGYVHNELGSFYYNGNCCWFWAITNKTSNSRNFNTVGDFYLTDGETCTRIPTRKKIWSDFKKAITIDLNKALKKFAKEEDLI